MFGAASSPLCVDRTSAVHRNENANAVTASAAACGGRSNRLENVGLLYQIQGGKRDFCTRNRRSDETGMTPCILFNSIMLDRDLGGRP